MHLRTHKNKPVKNFGSFDSFKFDGRKRKNNAVNHQKTAYGKGFGVPEVIRTPDLSLRSDLGIQLLSHFLCPIIPYFQGFFTL